MTRSNLVSVDAVRGLAAKRQEGADIAILDCRFDLMAPNAGRRQYQQGHLPGAVYVHLDDDLAGPITPSSGRHPLPDPGILAATFGRLGIGEHTEVVVYDVGNGAMAARAWWLLRWLDHDSVRLLDGGIARWIAAGHALSDENVRPAPRDFPARPRQELVLGTETLLAHSATMSALNLIDARDAPRFRGEQEPIDPVAGHVPGARNVPLTESLQDDGMWKRRDELSKLWESVLGPDRAVSWIVMCGSGVTACHLALSAAEAGYREPRLYAGSWSEWIRDPDRPVATGHA